MEVFLNKSGFIRAAVRFESIFVGKDIKIQVKIYEAEVKFPEKGGFRRITSNFSGHLSISLEFSSIIIYPIEG